MTHNTVFYEEIKDVGSSYEPKDFSSTGILHFIKRGNLLEGSFIDVSKK